jgi:hypothetical protein
MIGDSSPRGCSARKRHESDILKFYGELASAHSPLLDFKCSGDKYQALKSILRHHIKREQ